MMRTNHGPRRGSAGQTAVEFALAASVFLFVMFALTEMALVVYNYNTVCSAAREAVRYAIVHSPTSANPATTSEIQQVAINSAVNLNPAELTVNVSFPSDPRLPSRLDALVQVSYQYSLQIPFRSPVTFSLASSAQMLVSQ